MVLLDTRPIVSKSDLDPPEVGVWLKTCFDHKLSLSPHRFKRISYEIQESLLDLLVVGIDLRKVRIQMGRHGDALRRFLKNMGDDVQDDRDDFIGVNLDETAPHRRADKIETLLDELIQVLDFFLNDLDGLSQEPIVQIAPPLNNGERTPHGMEGISNLMRKEWEESF